MLLRNADTYRAIALRAGNECYELAPRSVENANGYRLIHYIIANRMTKLPVQDLEGIQFVGRLSSDKLPDTLNCGKRT